VTKNIAIICFGFSKQQVRSQPWHMANGVAMALEMEGFNINLLTDADDYPERNFRIHSLPALFEKNLPSKELLNRLDMIKPNTTLVFIGSHELLKPKRFRLAGKVHLVICNARFSLRELMRISPMGYWRERSLLMKPLLASLIPGWLLKWGYIQSEVDGVIYVSSAAQCRYSKLGLPRGALVLPAVEKEYSRESTVVKSARNGTKSICYYGPPLLLRGIDLVIDAFEDIAKKNNTVRLKLLLRLNGESYMQDRLDKILKKVNLSRYFDRIDVIQRYMSPSELKLELEQVTVVVLPFRLTVSDAPLVIIEAGLMGKPLVALQTPGVEEFINVFSGTSVSTSKGLSDAIVVALSKDTVTTSNAEWTDWAMRIKPISEHIL
jgi:glycosyltransferase involved in cell wall biosynthesis